MKDYICSIDIGSSLTRVLVGRPSEESLEIVGVGVAPSQGVRGAIVVNIESAVQGIVQAVREAELMSGLVVDHAIVNVSGRHLKGENSRGVVAVTNRDRVVDHSDVMRVIEGAQLIRLPADHEILHVLAREFKVDDQEGIKDPIGMAGVRLEAEVHIVNAARSALSNLGKAFVGAGIRMHDAVMSSLASAEAMITEAERDMGVAVVDIGGGVCDIAVYTDGGLFYSNVIPLGGIHVTQDLSIGLKMPVEQAETVKKTLGCAREDLVDPTEKVEMPAMPGRQSRWMLLRDVAAIIEPRMREIFELVDEQLVRSGRKQDLAGGLVLTGGGALLEGSANLAEDVFGMPVTVGSPAGLSGFADRVDGPQYATGTGLLKFAARSHADMTHHHIPAGRSGGGIIKKIKDWLSENI